MVMPFKFKDKKDIQGLSVGDSLKFRLIVTATNSYATDFTILGHSDVIDDSDGFWDDEYGKKEIGERLSDISLLDINGEVIQLSSLNGKFRFVSFIFTRCPIPNMCPAVIIKNGVLANNFRNNTKLELIMISFDYVYDTPDILNDFYGSSVSSYENWNVWSSSGSIADLYTLSSELGCEFWGIEENNIGHNLRSALIGPNMELLKVWEGDTWLAKDVRKDIEIYMAIVK
jgi:protein SCO1/2